MHAQQAVNLTDMIGPALEESPAPGRLGVLLAGVGVGKTACLTHIALDHLLRGKAVMHVCIDGVANKIRTRYQEMIRDLCDAAGEDAGRIKDRIGPLRFIVAYLQQTFTPAKLEQSIQDLKTQVNFNPALIILDGLDFDNISRELLIELQALALKSSVPMWMSARTHRHIETKNANGVPYPCHETDDLFQSVLLLEPGQEVIRVVTLKDGDRYNPQRDPIYLDSQTYLLQRK